MRTLSCASYASDTDRLAAAWFYSALDTGTIFGKEQSATRGGSPATLKDVPPYTASSKAPPSV